MSEEKGFTNPKTKELYETAEDFNWNRKIGIMQKYNGHVRDITPEVADLLIEQGRKDLWLKNPATEE